MFSVIDNEKKIGGKTIIRHMVLAQLVERLPTTPEVHSSKLVIGSFDVILTHVINNH